VGEIGRRKSDPKQRNGLLKSLCWKKKIADAELLLQHMGDVNHPIPKYGAGAALLPRCMGGFDSLENWDTAGA
jgi:hypothetical protein